jgi:hypothetical protein
MSLASMVLHNLQAAQKDLKDIQRQDKANRHKSLHDCLAEAALEVQDSDDPEAAQKTSKAIEAIICSEHRQESYDRIKRAIKGVSGNNRLDTRLDVPLRTSATTDPTLQESLKLTTFIRLFWTETRNTSVKLRKHPLDTVSFKIWLVFLV